MDILETKMKPMEDDKSNTDRKENYEDPDWSSIIFWLLRNS
jgi:hypothetical protein